MPSFSRHDKDRLASRGRAARGKGATAPGRVTLGGFTLAAILAAGRIGVNKRRLRDRVRRPASRKMWARVRVPEARLVRATPRGAIRLLRRTAPGRRLEFLLRRWRAGQRRHHRIPDECRPSMPGPPYPPYHTGLALEEYFFAYARGRGFAREYIPVFWTAAYLSGQRRVIQPALLSLSPSLRYFTVCQHDQASQEVMPPDTLVFSAGGLYRARVWSPSRSCAAACGTRSRSNRRTCSAPSWAL